MPRFKHQKDFNWKPHEQAFRELFPVARKEELLKRFPVSWQAIKMKAYRMGLERLNGIDRIERRPNQSWEKHHRNMQIKYGFDPDDHFPFKQIMDSLLREGLI